MLPARARRAQLDGYLARIVEHDFPEQGHLVRRPATLRAWLTAYAAATATTTLYNAILDAASPGDGDKPAKTTTAAYRDVLAQIWLLEPLPGWLPTRNPFARLMQAPKHHLADPALAARLLGASETSLSVGDSVGPAIPRNGQRRRRQTPVWLRNHLGPDLLDAAVITTGTHAYRRGDGIAVIPAALLGP